MRRLLMLLVLAIAVLAGAWALMTRERGDGAESGKDANVRPRVVSLNLNMTETLFALGLGDTLVARDRLSLYPPAARKTQNLGAYGQLNLEAILATRPTHVFGTSMVSKERILDPLERAGVHTEYIPFAGDLDECHAMIRTIADTLGVVPRGEALIERIESEMAPIREKVKARGDAPTPQVLCLALHGTRGGLLFGKGSVRDGLLRLVGAEAAFDLKGPKPMTPEAVFGTRADAILLSREDWKTIGGAEGLLQVPGVAQLPAGERRKFIVLPRRYIIAFGPDIAKAAAEAYKGLYETEGLYVCALDDEEADTDPHDE